MKVFLSWSGSRSRAVAELLRDWIRCVLQATRPWVSTRDLDRGSVWFGEINDQLKDTTVGVICLTQENKTRPWILFEAGALTKGLSTSRICTFLIDLQPKDIEDPLAQFNHTFPVRESMKGLIETLNNNLGQSALDHRILTIVFDTYWPQFESEFSRILKDTEAASEAKPRADSDILGEILTNTRQLTNRVSRLEKSEIQNNPVSFYVPTSFVSKRPTTSHSELVKMIQEFAETGGSKEKCLDMFSRLTKGIPEEQLSDIVDIVYLNLKEGESGKISP
jgi:hypothetical protein